MLHAPTQTRLGLATRYGAGDARCRHRSEKIANAFEFRRSVRWTEPRRPNLCHDFLENVRSKVAHIDECSVWFPGLLTTAAALTEPNLPSRAREIGCLHAAKAA